MNGHGKLTTKIYNLTQLIFGVIKKTNGVCMNVLKFQLNFDIVFALNSTFNTHIWFKVFKKLKKMKWSLHGCSTFSELQR